MDPLLVNLPNTDEAMDSFIEKIMNKKFELQKQQKLTESFEESGSNFSTESFVVDARLKQSGDCDLLESLLYLESKHRRLWNALTEVPMKYLERFNCLEDFLRYPGNILSKTDEFENVIPSNWDKASYTTKINQFGIYIPENATYMLIDRLLFIEMAKALPFFRRLDIEDQVALLKQTVFQMAILQNAYYSAEMGFDTWTRVNGLTFVTSYNSTIYRGNPKIHDFGKKKLCFSVSKMKDAGMAREEFILLLIILFCNTYSSKLSQLAKDQLYTESVRHSRALLNLLQGKHGPEKGANKYAEYIYLLETVVNIEHITEVFMAYIEAINFKFKVQKHCLECPNVLDNFMLI